MNAPIGLDVVAEALAEISFGDWQIVRGLDGDRQYLHVLAETTDLTMRDGTLAWTGRRWYLKPDTTKGEIVQTAFKAVMTAVEHEARERFLYRGRPIFGPHFDIDKLHAACKDPHEAGA